MSRSMVRSVYAAVAAILASTALTSTAHSQTQRESPALPTEGAQIRFKSGQNVVPYFEGWIKNADGSFDLVFGYFNRNWEQELAVPVGPANKVEPGAADQGQPTYFLPRRQRLVFRARVPADFAKKELVWTLTTNGRTERAYGSLIPAQEINERVIMTNGGYNPGHDDPNKPPALTIEPVKISDAAAPVTLTAAVTDDGLPKPKAPPSPKPSATGAAANPFTAQVNSSGAAPRPRGLTVSWMLYRGPAGVAFDRTGQIPVVDGKASTTARFAAPGTYVLIATANDGALSQRTRITVTVPAQTQ